MPEKDDGCTGVLQVVTELWSGAVIAKLTPAPGWIAPDTPVTVAVRVIGRLIAGLAAGIKVIVGVARARATVRELEATV